MMTFRRAVPVAFLLGFALCVAMRAQSSSAQQVTALLNEFMQAAGQGNRDVFDKFFADDVIYTRATGVVISKTDIMQSLGKPGSATDGKTTYAAEDLTLHEYRDIVVVAFRLVGRTEHSDGKMETAYYRNTGTFLRRNGKWQAVAWQATKSGETGKAQ